MSSLKSNMSLVLLIVLLTLMPIVASAQDDFEEIVLSFEIQRILSRDLFVLYDGQTIYLPMVEMFGMMGINVTGNWNEEIVHGTFIERKRRYELDLRSGTARTWQGEFMLPQGSYSLANRELYLRLDLFKRLFGLDLQFDFSQLQVFMKFDESLPAYQKIKRKLAQKKNAHASLFVWAISATY